MTIVRGGSGTQDAWFESDVTKLEVRLIAAVTQGWYRFAVTEPMYVYVDDPLGTSIPVLINPDGGAEQFKIQSNVSIYATAVDTRGDVSLTRVRAPQS